jgi:hypothetical protein
VSTGTKIEKIEWTRDDGTAGSTWNPVTGCDEVSEGCDHCYAKTFVWLGVSVEDQKRVELRIPALIQTPAAVRFLSCEPLLGPVDLSPWLGSRHQCPGELTPPGNGPARVHTVDCCTNPALDWVIIGGESGPARGRCTPTGPAPCSTSAKRTVWRCSSSNSAQSGPATTTPTPEARPGHDGRRYCGCVTTPRQVLPDEHPPISAALGPAPRSARLARVPITPGAKKPPVIDRWETRATTDPDQIRRWWHPTGPRYTIGIATGPSGLIIIDLDTTKPGEPVPDRWATLRIGSGPTRSRSGAGASAGRSKRRRVQTVQKVLTELPDTARQEAVRHESDTEPDSDDRARNA